MRSNLSNLKIGEHDCFSGTPGRTPDKETGFDGQKSSAVAASKGKKNPVSDDRCDREQSRKADRTE